MDEVVAGIRTHRAQILAEVARLRAQMVPLLAEASACDRAILAIEAKPGQSKVRDQILSLLADGQMGLSSASIALCLPFPATSTRSQLSRMVAQGRLKNVDGLYRLVVRSGGAQQAREPHA